MGWRCDKCGDKSEGSFEVIYRTQQPDCFVFQGEPGDFRNGIKFHTKDGVIIEKESHVYQGIVSNDPAEIAKAITFGTPAPYRTE